MEENERRSIPVFTQEQIDTLARFGEEKGWNKGEQAWNKQLLVHSIIRVEDGEVDLNINEEVTKKDFYQVLRNIEHGIHKMKRGDDGKYYYAPVDTMEDTLQAIRDFVKSAKEVGVKQIDVVVAGEVLSKDIEEYAEKRIQEMLGKIGKLAE